MCPFHCSTSLFFYFPTRSSVWSVIQFLLLYSIVSWTFNKKKKERKTAATCNLLTKGASFIPAFSCQHPRWVTPAKTGTVIFNLSERLADSTFPQRLVVSHSHSWNIKAKSEPGAYVIVGYTLKISPHSCWTGQATHVHQRPWRLRVFVRMRNPIHVSLHLVAVLT